MSSWKKFGGIKQFDAFTHLNVNSITTDDFVMREAYKGTFTIVGELFVTSDCSLNANVGIGKNVNISESCYVDESIYIGNNERQTLNTIKTSSSGLGINVDNPVAILDISGSSSKIINVHSSQLKVSSTIARNGDGNTVDFTLDTSGAAISFSFPSERKKVSLTYDISDERMSLNTDISFGGDSFLKKNAYVDGNINVYRNAFVYGNILVGSNLTVSGDMTLVGDFDLKGNATMEYATIRKETTHNGNIKINGNSGIWFDSINHTNAIIRPYTSTDSMKSGIPIPIGGGTPLYLNCDVIIGGNVYIDGSTNLIGNITQLSGITSGGTNLDISGTLVDLSGTDQTRFYVNFHSNNTSFPGAGFYIYNRLPTKAEDASQEPYNHHHGFIKISDVSSNKYSLRTTGERNTVALDFSKLKNQSKSGLLVLKHADMDEDTDTKDNYNIISSHCDLSFIDVSNSLTGVVDLHVGNLIYCSKNIIVDMDLSVNRHVLVAGNIYSSHAVVKNLSLGEDLYLSPNGTTVYGSITDTMNIYDLVGNNFNMLSGNISSVLTANVMMVNMGQGTVDDKYKGIQSVAALLLDLKMSSTEAGTVTTKISNSFKMDNYFAGQSFFSGDVSMTGILYAHDISFSGKAYMKYVSISENVDILGTTFLKDTFMDGKKMDISGNLSVTGDSCLFNNSIVVVRDVSLGGSLYVLSGDIITRDISVNNNVLIGNRLTTKELVSRGNLICNGDLTCLGKTVLSDTNVRGLVDLSGSISVHGTLFGNASCIFNNSFSVMNDITIGGNLYTAPNFKIMGSTAVQGILRVIDGNITTTNDISCGGNFYVGGNIFLKNGLNIKSGLENYVITPRLFSFMNDLSENIQTQIDRISSNANNDNTFTGNNTFSGVMNTFSGNNIFTKTVSVTTLSCETLYGQNLNLSRTLTVGGKKKSISYPNPDGGYCFVQDNLDGDIYTTNNIYCTGKPVKRHLIQDENNTEFIRNTSPEDFFANTTAQALFPYDNYIEGGMITCTDISLARTLRLGSGGTLKVLGNISTMGNYYSADKLNNALYAFPESAVGSEILLGNSNKNIQIPGNLEVKGTLTIGNIAASSIYAVDKRFWSQNIKNALSAFSDTVPSPVQDVHLGIAGGTVHIIGDYLKVVSGKLVFPSTSADDMKIDVSGQIRCTGTVFCATIGTSSDHRMKENIQTISGSFYSVDNLRPVSYTLKTTNSPHIGFIAHELQEYFPTAVHGIKDGPEMQSVNYIELIPVLVKEIQELKKEIHLLKQKFA